MWAGGPHVIRLFRRTNRDLSYLTDDLAEEIATPRSGPAQWWIRGADTSLDDLLARSPHIIGYDLVIAAPRPTSALVVIGDVAERAGAVAAHRSGVSAAIDYLAERAVVQRFVVGGFDDVAARPWERAVGFTHGVNRNAEPHLHDHVLVSSTPGPSDRPLNQRTLWAHLETADSLYRAHLRAEITERTGRRAWRSFRGIEHVEGVDEGVRMLWPGRASDRPAKIHWREEQIREQWASDWAHYDAGPEAPVPRGERHLIDEHRFGAALAWRDSISRRDVVRAFADAAVFGARAPSVSAAIDSLFPELNGATRAQTISAARARMDRDVSERGPRPIDPHELAQWNERPSSVRPRSRDRSR